jgi:hypothetical protein
MGSEGALGLKFMGLGLIIKKKEGPTPSLLFYLILRKAMSHWTRVACARGSEKVYWTGSGLWRGDLSKTH